MHHKQLTAFVLALAFVPAISTAGAAGARGDVEGSRLVPRMEAGPAAHATRGIVRSSDTTTLVIDRFGHRGEMTFERRPSTTVDGTIAVGATVSVRYRDEGGKHVATAIAEQRPRKDVW